MFRRSFGCVLCFTFHFECQIIVIECYEQSFLRVPPMWKPIPKSDHPGLKLDFVVIFHIMAWASTYGFIFVSLVLQLYCSVLLGCVPFLL